MASPLTLSTPLSSLRLFHHHKQPPPSKFHTLFNSSSATQYLAINYHICDTKSSRKTSGRGLSVITRAGPSSTSYIFAFVFPLSLLAVTIFTASRITDKLDQKFLEELAVNQEILEAEGGDDNDGTGAISIEQEPAPAPPRTRNRPKREVESTST